MSSPSFFRFFLLVMVCGGLLRLHGQETQAGQHLEITGQHTLRLIYDCTFTWPSGGGYEALIQLPIPPDTGAQHIDHFTSSIKGTTEVNDGNPAHRMLVATLHHRSGEDRRVHWQVVITGVFETRQLASGPPAADTIITGPADGEFLASSGSINWKAEGFQNWLDSAGLRRKSGESAVDYGRRLYRYLETHGRYTYPPETAWNAAAVCHHLRSDCGGFSLVFTAACRANRIPARVLAGQCFKAVLRDGSTELTGGRQAHVIAEFFDPQIGWIPEDISSTFLKTPGFPNLDFFGRDPGYFFAWHVDTDFRFDTPQKPNAKVQWIQNPSPWFSANASGVYDSLSHHWTVETVK